METGALLNALRGRSSAGRAPALQAGGHEFDPRRLHQPSLAAKLE
jgi:hypothetical protein